MLGRVTYEEFAAFWPYQDRAEQPYTDYLNNTPKYVVSTTLDEPLEWQNSILIKGNVAEEVSRLKEQPGKDISIVGSGTLVRALLREELLDEFKLMVHPILLGRGRRLFEEGEIRRHWSSLIRRRSDGRPLPHLPAGTELKLRAQKEDQAARAHYLKLSPRRCRVLQPS